MLFFITGQVIDCLKPESGVAVTKFADFAISQHYHNSIINAFMNSINL